MTASDQPTRAVQHFYLTLYLRAAGQWGDTKKLQLKDCVLIALIKHICDRKRT